MELINKEALKALVSKAFADHPSVFMGKQDVSLMVSGTVQDALEKALVQVLKEQLESGLIMFERPWGKPKSKYIYVVKDSPSV